MRILLISTLLVLFSLLVHSTSSPNPSSSKCDSSPLAILLETHYTGHQYKWINKHRPVVDFIEFAKTIELKDPQNYDIIDKIGSGNFGTVSLARHKNNHTAQYVLKALKNACDSEKVAKEIYFLKQLDNAPNTIPLLAVFPGTDEDRTTTCSFMFDYFKSSNYRSVSQVITRKQLKEIAYKVFRTLDYMHSIGIIHRDIKPDNVLINPETTEVRIIDMNQAVHSLPGKRMSLFVLPTESKPPEILLDYKYYDYAVDVWSAGILVFELAFSKHPFPPSDYEPELELKRASRVPYFSNFRNVLDAVSRILGTRDLLRYCDKFKSEFTKSFCKSFPEYEKVSLKSFVDETNENLADDPLLIDLLENIFVYDHTKRFTAADALLHPYFSQVRAK